MITRRHLFALSTLTAAAGAIGLAGTGLSWWNQPAGGGYKHFSEAEAAFLRKFAETAYPSTPTISVSGGEVGVDHFLDATMGAAPDVSRNLVRVLLHALETATWPTHMASFQDLSDDERNAVLLGWLGSGLTEIRSATESLVILVGMAYTSHPGVAPHFAQYHRCGFGR